jgi:hypothetical protein
MIVGIMQPYFLPYLGYWQLINSVDKFVIYDDVNYIKGGWINRNRYLYNGEAKVFNIIMKNSSSFKKINEIELMGSQGNYNPMKKLYSTFEMAYRKAPYFNDISILLKNILEFNENNLANFIGYSMKCICEYLGIKTELIMSSDIKKEENLVREKRVMDICKKLGADIYINPIGGIELYDKKDFLQNNLKLYFIKMNEIIYKQFSDEFVPNLSIIDVLMFNSRQQIQEYLKLYTLL